MDAPRLHVEADGDGPAVVLAHGFAGSARNWGPQVRALRARHRVVRYDARGHARSEAPADPAAYTPGTFAADLGRALDAAGAPSAVVGGLSMGAATALRFALAHPERTDGLVLCAFPAGPDDPRGFAAHAVAFADAIERDGIDAAGAAYVWGPGSRLDAQTAAFVRRGFLEHPAHGLAHTLRGVIAAEPPVATAAADLARVACAVLIVVGAADAPSLAASRALAAAAPRAELVVVPGAGHVVNLARPAAVGAALEGFLAAGARRR
jgi:pimeloyl-ACP methyl ester carboxylesterase